MLESIIARTRTTPAETEEGLEHDDIAISPIGIPIVTGPGAITAVMVLAGEADGARLSFADDTALKTPIKNDMEDAKELHGGACAILKEGLAEDGLAGKVKRAARNVGCQ